MSYSIVKQGNTLVVTNSTGNSTRYLPLATLTIEALATAPFPDERTNVLVLYSGPIRLPLALADITSIDGVTLAANALLADAAGLISALIPAGSSGSGSGGTVTPTLLINNLTQLTASAGALDAAQGKVLSDLITAIKGGSPVSIATLVTQLNTLQALVTSTTPDADNFVNTIQELLAIFATYPEGADVVQALAGKVNTGDVVNNLTTNTAGKVMDARQGPAITTLINNLAATVGGKEATGIAQTLVDALKGGSTETIGSLKAQLNTLNALVTGTTPDADNVVNTIQELLAVFATYPEGADIATLLSGKLDKSLYDTNRAADKADVTTNTNNISTNSAAITANTNNIAANTAALGNKVDKVSGKGLSDVNYSQAEKDKLSGLPSSFTPVTDNAQIANGAGYQTLSQVTSAIVTNRIRSRRPSGIITNGTTVVSKFGGYNSGFSDGTSMSRTYRWQFTPTVTCHSIRLTFGNWELANSGNKPGGATNNITVKVGIYPSPVPVQFGSQVSATIGIGATITTDPINTILVAGNVYFIYVNVSVTTSGMKWPLGIYMLGGNEGTQEGDFSDGTGTWTSSTAPGYGPVAIKGVIINPQATTGDLMIIGTSIAAGRSGDTNDFGWCRRGADAAGIAWGRMAVGGGKLSNVYATGSAAGAYGLMNMLGYDYGLCEHFANDMNVFANLAAAQTEFIRAWFGYASSVGRLYQSTGLPRNDFTATAKQIKNDFNDWLRDGAPMSNGVAVAIGTVGALRAGQAGHPLWGYIEAADLAETARNSNIQKSGMFADGVHLTPSGAATVGSCLTQALFPIY